MVPTPARVLCLVCRVVSEGNPVTATDLLVTDTMRADCATGDCADGSGGIGVGSYMDATLDVQRFAVQRAVLCGVHVALGASLFLADGEVAESSIGACIQVAGYDLDRIIGDVAYRDNDTNLEATDLPVPMSLPTAGGV